MEQFEELEVSAKAKKVFEENSDYISDLQKEVIATKEELDKYEYVSLSFEGDNVYLTDGNIIPIQKLKELIERAEASGANFVAIDYHSDHDEYEVYGYYVERMTQDEIDVIDAIKAENTKKANEAKIKRLEEQIEKLKRG